VVQKHFEHRVNGESSGDEPACVRGSEWEWDWLG